MTHNPVEPPESQGASDSSSSNELAGPDHQPRKFGFWAAYFLVVASMVGAGILTSSGFTLHDTANPGGLMVIWTLGGILALCGTVTIAELATMLPRAGSDYLFVREAFGREAGIVVGWATFVLGFAAPTAVVARLSANYLSIPMTEYFEFGSTQPYLEPMLATLFVGVLMTIHCLGHRESSGLQVLSTLVKICLLVGLVVIGLSFGDGDWGHFADSHVPDSQEFFTLGIGLIYVSYAYTGWNAAAYVAGEVRDPERLLPRSLIAGCASVMGLYLLVNLTYVFALDPQEMTQLSIPEVIPVAQLAAKKLFGTQVADVVSILLGLGMLASVSAYMLSGPRIAFAMANDGAFPRFAAKLHDRRQTPIAAIVVQGLIAIGMVWSGPFLDILNYTAIGLAVISGLVVASIFPLRNRENLPHPYRLPLYPLPPILYLVLMGWIVASGLMQDVQGLQLDEPRLPTTILSLLTILLGLPVAYFLARRNRAS
ncbi:APC family permease [Bremerella sp. P1]|uniref:APC family permease n=1 Tax=Bremerella sp. P1 TaxID=3026424 RepID=UPI00236834F5|nr:APC family permease [Bremerella sp. P1]WDI43420.1 APC family permease [Bremerella sp. P1]